MMLYSNAPVRDFTANPLRAGTGMGRLGMTDAEARAAIAGGAGPGTEAYEQYYGAGGTYAQAESVERAQAEREYENVTEPAGPPAPMLYAAMPCGPQEMLSGPCVSFNAQVQNANLVLQENARRAYHLQACEYNAAVNPGTATDLNCEQYRGGLPEPPAPPSAVKQQAVCSGGECYTPYAGQTPTAPSSAPAREVAPPTPQQQASYISGRPNQTVPPRGQPGEVAVDGGWISELPPLTGGGKIFGLDPMILAAAALGVLLVLRK